MEKLSREEWLDAIHDVAVDAGNNYVKFVEQFDTPAEGLDEKVIGDIENFLKKKYAYDVSTNDDIETLKKFTPESIWKWEVHSKADGDEYDPRAKHEAAELAKYMPFLKGVAPEGKSWLDGRQDLKLKGSELGFDYNLEGMGKFLDKLRKYQTVYDRGQMMKELRSEPWYWPTRIAWPSLMEGAENAISTGGDLSAGQMAALMGLDAGTNVAMFGLPGTAALKVQNPIAAGILDAVGQGALELNRQYGKTDIDPTLEADPAQAIAAATFGATRPGIVGTAQGAVSKIPGKNAMAISRGIGKSTRAGNPVENERETIMQLVKNHNDLLTKNREKLANQPMEVVGLTPAENALLKQEVGGHLNNVSVVDTENMLGSKRVEEMAKTLGVKAKEDGTYNIDEIMKAYDRRPVYSWFVKGNETKIDKPTSMASDTRKLTKWEKIGRMLTEPEKGWQSSEKLFHLTPDNAAQYKSLFPAKYADEAQASKARTAGLVLGKALGDFGGRFEPTFKLNPLNVGPQNFPEYRKQDWYTRLGPKSRAIIDEAFKKKMEEDEEQFYLDVE